MESNDFESTGSCRKLHFPAGECRVIQVGPKPVLVLHRDTDWIAFEDYCPHRAGPLSEGEWDASSITCPWHGARFDLKTGQVVSGPCRRGLRMRSIKVEHERVWVS